MFLRKLLPYDLAGASLLVGLMLSAYAVNLSHVSMPRRTLDEQVALIRPHTEIRLPETTSEPVPVEVMMHGCG